MAIEVEEDDYYLKFEIDPYLNSESTLEKSSTTLAFKLKVRNIYRYFIVYKSRKLLFAKLVGKEKRQIKLSDNNILLIYFAILQTNIMINRNPENINILSCFAKTLIEIIKEDSK